VVSILRHMRREQDGMVSSTLAANDLSRFKVLSLPTYGQALMKVFTSHLEKIKQQHKNMTSLSSLNKQLLTGLNIFLRSIDLEGSRNQRILVKCDVSHVRSCHWYGTMLTHDLSRIQCSVFPPISNSQTGRR
jgi:hypothetical protein